eukprot:3857150-Pleurochrysis_carterae.AAC.1
MGVRERGIVDDGAAMGVESVLEVQGFQVADAMQREHGVIDAISCQGRDGFAFGPAIRRLAI